MLTTYDRILRERRKLTQLQVKMLEDRLARADAPGVSDEHVVLGAHVVQVIKQSDTNKGEING